MHPKYGATVDEIRAWSRREKDIRSALVLGSQVRSRFEGD